MYYQEKPVVPKKFKAMKFTGDVRALIDFMMDCNPVSVLEGDIRLCQNGKVKVNQHVLENDDDNYYIIYEKDSYRTVFSSVFEEMYIPIEQE